MAERLAGIREEPPGAALALLLAVAALLLGAASAAEAIPWAVRAAVVVVPLAAFALWPLGRGAFLLALIAIVPLFPVSTIGPAMNAFGGNGDLLRTAFIALATGGLLLAHLGRIPKPPARLRPLTFGLLLLAGLGAFAAVANASPSQSMASLFGQLVGQPALFAVLLILMASYLRGGSCRATGCSPHSRSG